MSKKDEDDERKMMKMILHREPSITIDGKDENVYELELQLVNQ